LEKALVLLARKIRNPLLAQIYIQVRLAFVYECPFLIPSMIVDVAVVSLQQIVVSVKDSQKP
jgi:hypothetical protein